MRRLALGVLVVLTAAFVACGGDDDEGPLIVTDDDLTPAATVVERTAQPTRAATTPAEPSTTLPGETAEVQGIIGAIDSDLGYITINQLQGPDVERIEVGEGTEFRSAGGRTITFADLRVSDRIIATGEVEGGALVATLIEISQVAPGSQPGG
jgi:hypothetical protein